MAPQVAEFGCSHGANSVKPVRAVLQVLQERVSGHSEPAPAIKRAPAGGLDQPGRALLGVMVSHEDLPTNSWWVTEIAYTALPRAMLLLHNRALATCSS